MKEQKKKSLAETRLTTDELLKKLKKSNGIIASSSETFKVGDSIIETLKITRELYRRHLRVE